MPLCIFHWIPAHTYYFFHVLTTSNMMDVCNFILTIPVSDIAAARTLLLDISPTTGIKLCASIL